MGLHQSVDKLSFSSVHVNTLSHDATASVTSTGILLLGGATARFLAVYVEDDGCCCLDGVPHPLSHPPVDVIVGHDQPYDHSDYPQKIVTTATMVDRNTTKHAKPMLRGTMHNANRKHA